MEALCHHCSLKSHESQLWPAVLRPPEAKIKTFSHGSSARWNAYLPHKNERVFCWSRKTFSHLLLCTEWSSVYERQLCQIWIPCGAGAGCTWAPYCSADRLSVPSALCPGCSRADTFGLPLCVHIIVLSLFMVTAPISLCSWQFPPNLQKCWEVPGEWETKMEFRSCRSLFTWKPYVSVLNEQRTCPFFYRDGFPWELCCERDFTLCKRPEKKLSWRSEKWRL